MSLPLLISNVDSEYLEGAVGSRALPRCAFHARSLRLAGLESGHTADAPVQLGKPTEAQLCPHLLDFVLQLRGAWSCCFILRSRRWQGGQETGCLRFHCSCSCWCPYRLQKEHPPVGQEVPSWPHHSCGTARWASWGTWPCPHSPFRESAWWELLVTVAPGGLTEEHHGPVLLHG